MIGSGINRSPKEHHLKAILHTQYGSPDLLQLKEIDKPTPRDNEVLIAVHATFTTEYPAQTKAESP